MAIEARPILIVDDDAAVCWALGQALEHAGFQVCSASSTISARRLITRSDPALVITDVRLPGRSGLDLLDDLRRDRPDLPVILTTAYGTIDTAIAAVERGAFGYLPKPLDFDRTKAMAEQAYGRIPIAMRFDPQSALASDSGLVGSSPPMQEVYRRLAAAASSDLGVMITGATGTGKELVAHAIHNHSKRRDWPFVAVNCGAIPESLIETELFGHVAGSFTGATSENIGRCRAAAGGTLFLDEIGTLPSSVQSSLFRFLEDHHIRPVGNTNSIAIDVRVIAATNADVSGGVESGLRNELIHRLRGISISMPTLSQRLEDIPMLTERLLGRLSRRIGRQLAITQDAIVHLQRQSWPGNVRELKHRLEEAAVFAPGGIIGIEQIIKTHQAEWEIPIHATISSLASKLINQHPGEVHKRFMNRIMLPLLETMLNRTNGNYLEASRILGINRITLRRWMDAYHNNSQDTPSSDLTTDDADR